MEQKPRKISLLTASLAATTSLLCLAVALQRGWLEGQPWLPSSRFVSPNGSIVVPIGTEQEIRQVSLGVFQALQRLGDEPAGYVSSSGTFGCRDGGSVVRKDGLMVGGYGFAPKFITGCTGFISSINRGSDRFIVIVDGLTANGPYRSIRGRLGRDMASTIIKRNEETERQRREFERYSSQVHRALNILTKDRLIAELRSSGASCENLNLKNDQGNLISSWNTKPVFVASCQIAPSGQNKYSLTVTGSSIVARVFSAKVGVGGFTITYVK